MTNPDHDLNPALQEWIDARQRETKFSDAVKQASLSHVKELTDATTTALRDIAETGNCGHRINLQNALDYLTKPDEERTEDDTRAFSSALENLSEAFGADNAVTVYRAWERKPQTPSVE